MARRFINSIMKNLKPYTLSIAGFDPSGGAGLLADNKTFEANGVYGFGVVSAITYQNDIAFEKVEWVSIEKIIQQIQLLQARFPIRFIKIGLVENLHILQELVLFLKSAFFDAFIIWDPVLKASAGFTFHNIAEGKLLKEILSAIYCITPNNPEAKQLFGEEELHETLLKQSTDCAIYLKGGHAESVEAVDTLYTRGQTYSYGNIRLPKGGKHGSGCVLSSALIAQLALGNDLITACKKANEYTHQVLASNETLLGYHQYQF